MSDIDDLSLDFTDVEGRGGFDKLPNGRYLLQVVDWEATEVGPDAAKMDPGTPGIKFELDVVEPEEHAGRKLWSNYWLAASSFPYFKGFLAATGLYSQEQLDGNLGAARDVADHVVEEQPKLVAKVGVQKNNPEYNDIKGWFPESEWKGSASEASSSMMP